MGVADKLTETFEPFVVDVTFGDIKEVMTLRLKNKDMSIPDAIGYTVARRYNVQFLTGDADFKELPNVEFVKR